VWTYQSMGRGPSDGRCAAARSAAIVTAMNAILCIVAAGLWGLLAGWWTPRGPLTVTEALCSVAISAAIGWAAGRAIRSRWLLFAVPAVFVITLELVRIGRHLGPSADLPHPSVFGVLVLLAGRGVQALLTVLPMLLAAAWARGVRGRGRVRQVLIALPTAVLLVFTAVVAVPARTAPIPGGVAELARVGDLNVLIRGARTDLPVLLFVPGAPGGSELGAVRTRLGALEKQFVMATLDRRGGGASYPALDPTGRVTLDRVVTDIVEVTDYLRDRFARQRIYLLGHSGGSILSVLAVTRHPEKFHAYIGTGQAVDLAAGDRIFYDDIRAWARATGRPELDRQLERQGPPPYGDVWSYEPFMLYENQAYGQKDLGFVIGVREYTLLQKAHTINAILDSWQVLYPQMQDIDLRRDVPSLPIPAYFVQGGNEMRGLSEPFGQWYERLAAPRKELIVVPGAGHRVIFEEPAVLAETMNRVLTENR
jgi:pimeloyl-ACP methyl ester carboxylesterase